MVSLKMLIDLTKINIKNIGLANRCVKQRCKAVYGTIGFKEILCFKR